jgi:hypothetical protein
MMHGLANVKFMKIASNIAYQVLQMSEIYTSFCALIIGSCWCTTKGTVWPIRYSEQCTLILSSVIQHHSLVDGSILEKPAIPNYFYPEHGGNRFFWNINMQWPNYVASHPRRWDLKPFKAHGLCAVVFKNHAFCPLSASACSDSQNIQK